MLQNSNETITLPSFELTMVAADTQEATAVQLNQLLNQSHQGLIFVFFTPKTTRKAVPFRRWILVIIKPSLNHWDFISLASLEMVSNLIKILSIKKSLIN